MAKVLLTYDIKETSATIHQELKNKLIDDYGFFSDIKGRNKEMALPDKTLIKRETSIEQTISFFKAACEDVGAKWTRFIAVDYLEATFNSQDITRIES